MRRQQWDSPIKGTELEKRETDREAPEEVERGRQSQKLDGLTGTLAIS